eukprot:ANDGO_03344.mRNA.1 hypothetical protein SAMD00019534_047360
MGRTLLLNFNYAPPTVTGAYCGSSGSPCLVEGDALTIIGSNFGISAPTVAISLPSPYAAVNPTSCTVPSHTQAICQGFKGVGTLVDVTLTRSYESPQQSSSLADAFSFIPPSISLWSCNGNTATDSTNCRTDGGDVVTIVGTNLGTSLAHVDSVSVQGSLAGTLYFDSSTQVRAVLPAGIGPSTADITIQVGGQTSSGVAFHYESPAITSAACNGGTCKTSGDVLTVVGKNFGNTAGSLILSHATYATVSPTSCTAGHTTIECSGFTGASTGIGIEFTQNGFDAKSAVLSSAFSFRVPEITSYACSPECGTAGSSVLTLTGKEFSQTLGSVDYVRVGGVDCLSSAALVSHTSLTCTLPEGPQAVNDLQISVGAQVSSVIDFDYAAVTLQTASCSNSGGLCKTTGDTVTLTGKNFGQSAPTVSLTLPSSFVGSVSPSCIVSSGHATVKCSGFTGVGQNVIIKYERAYEDDNARTQTTLPAAFSFIAPSLSKYSCTSASGSSDVMTKKNAECRTDGSATITFEGDNFGPQLATNVQYLKIGSVNCLPIAAVTATLSSHSKIVCSLPEGVSVDASEKNTVELRIGNQDLVGTVPSFHYAEPTIASISCSTGSLCKTHLDTITIVGTNFGKYAPKIDLSDPGTVPKTYTQLSPVFPGSAVPTSSGHNCYVASAHTTIYCSNFKGAGTNIDVQFTRADSQTVSTSFSYIPPAITAYSCSVDVARQYDNDCATDGTATLTLTGTNFPHVLHNLDSVSVGNAGTRNPCTGSAVWIDDDTFQCILPEGPEYGTNTLQMTVGNQAESSAASFSYAAPIISSARCVQEGGINLCSTFGDALTITGKNFGKFLPNALDPKVTIDAGTFNVRHPTSCIALSGTNRHFGLVCTSLEAVSTNIDVTLTRGDTAVHTLPDAFSFRPPTISKFWCSTGSNGLAELQGSGSEASPGNAYCRTDGSSSITFRGENFGWDLDHVQTLSIGGDAGNAGGETSCHSTYARLSPDTGSARHQIVTCRLPELSNSMGSIMNLDITVGGQTARLSNGFAYRSPFIKDVYCGGAQAFNHHSANGFDSAGGPPADAPGKLCRTTGDTLTIFGDDFGSAGSVVSLSRSGRWSLSTSPTCVHDQQSNDFKHRTVFCDPATFHGVGTSVATLITRTDTYAFSKAASFSFAPPRIDSHLCSSAGLSGSSSNCETDSNTITVSGVNFGSIRDDVDLFSIGSLYCDADHSPNWMVIDPSGNTADYAEPVSGSLHVKVACRTPIQAGASLPMQLKIGGQVDVSSPQTTFTYTAPSIVSHVCNYYDAWNGGSIATATCGTHDTTVTVSGHNFGRSDEALVLKIDGKDCTFASRAPTNYPADHHTVICSAPENTGINQDIFVSVGSQTMTQSGSFSYVAPDIRYFNCSSRSDFANGDFCSTEGTTLTITGDHFGKLPAEVSVTLTNTESASAATSSDHCIPGQSDCSPITCTNVQFVSFTPPGAPKAYSKHTKFTCDVHHGYGISISTQVRTRSLFDSFDMSFHKDPVSNCLSASQDYLFVDIVVPGGVNNVGSRSSSAVDMIRDAIFAGYDKSKIIGIFEPSVSGLTTEASVNAAVTAQFTAAFSMFENAANAAPQIPLMKCYIRVLNAVGWSSSQANNYAGLMTLKGLLDGKSSGAYPRCMEVGIMTDFPRWKSIVGDVDDPAATHFGGAAFPLRTAPVIYYNYNGGNVGSTDATFKNYVDETIPGPIGQSANNYDGWERSDIEAFPKNAAAYNALVGSDARCANLGIDFSTLTEQN